MSLLSIYQKRWTLMIILQNTEVMLSNHLLKGKQSYVAFKAQQLYYANENNDLKHEQHIEELIHDINLIQSEFLRKKYCNK